MKKTLLFITALLLGALTSLCQAKIRLHITTGFTPPVADFYRKVFTEMDKRLPDISISFEALPAERALILVNQGINDGECCRVPTALKHKYKNLIPVDVSFSSIQFSAFTKKQNKPVHSFQALKPFSVGTIEGWKVAINKIKAINPAQLYIVSTPKQLFQMLDQGRINYGVFGHLSGLKSIAELNLHDIRVIEPPLVAKPIYLMLNSKHSDLIPAFNAVIKQMMDDGTINRLHQQLTNSIK